jgi:hypothetical protein
LKAIAKMKNRSCRTKQRGRRLEKANHIAVVVGIAIIISSTTITISVGGVFRSSHQMKVPSHAIA